MARRLRVEYEGAMYHVTIRGVERRPIFRQDADRERMLARLGEAQEAFGVRVYLYVLMGNHVHLLVETPQANLSAFMHQFQTAYTVYYNRRYRRAGHLMQGRFGAVLVQGDRYLLNLSRYIHLNPVCVGALRNGEIGERRRYLRAYRWSSYRGYVGLAKPVAWLDEGPILALMGGAKPSERQAYGRFVESGLAETDEELMELLRTARWGIGDHEFQEKIRDRHTSLIGEARRPEDIAFRRVVAVTEASTILRAIGAEFGVEEGMLRRRQYRCQARVVAALLLGRYAGMNQRDVAGYLAMGSGAAVCQHLKRLRVRLASEPELAARVAAVAQTITSRNSASL